MWRLLTGFCLGLVMGLPMVEAVRLPKPPTFTHPLNESSIAQLNSYLESLWQLTNGRLTVDVVTSTPNGSRVGTRGDIVFYLNGTAWKFCVNTTATTSASPTGTTWQCSANAMTSP